MQGETLTGSEYAPYSDARYARTRYHNGAAAPNPLSPYVVVLAGSVAISSNDPGTPPTSGARSTLNPSSPRPSGSQARSTRFAVNTVARRLAGALSVWPGAD